MPLALGAQPCGVNRSGGIAARRALQGIGQSRNGRPTPHLLYLPTRSRKATLLRNLAFMSPDSVQFSAWSRSQASRCASIALIAVHRRVHSAAGPAYGACLRIRPAASWRPNQDSACQLWVETTRPRTSASEHRTFNVSYPAMTPMRRQSQADPSATFGDRRPRLES
jgi:hypothetical protein